MTIVNHDTGEVIEPMSVDDARSITTQARTEFKSSADHFANGWTLVEQAVVGGGHLALGYRSPGEYLHSEFDGVLADLDVASRRVAVRQMVALGLSTRAIAPVVGTSQKTVVKDSQVIPEVSPHPNSAAQAEAQARIDAREDKARQRAYRGLDDLVADCSRPAPVEPEPMRTNVIGLDGKSYTRPEPKPKPVALTDSAADYDNAEKASKSLSNAIAKLLEFQHPNMREAMRRYWSMASNEVPPTPRRDVTPEQMRVAAQGLLALADEWSKP